jgi:hypothetical protein
MRIAGIVFTAAILAVSGCSDEKSVFDGGGGDGGPPDGSVSDGGFKPQDAGHFDKLACADVAGTAKNLRQKAEYFDTVGQQWHVPAGQDLWFSVELNPDKTYKKVDMSDNQGTWTSMYAASQAFRYAATKSPAALDNLRRAVRGMHNMERITGVRGLYSRNVVNPALPGFPTTDWLKNAYAGCDLSVEHCKRFNEVPDGEFKGLWFKNDVSKDEYAAHMFANAVIWEIVDDPEVRKHVEEVVLAVGDHLVDKKLQITDIDGKVTTFGRMNAMAFDDWAGFNAILSLSWVKLAAVVGGKKYDDFYRNCLLQQKGKKACITGEDPAPYTSYLDQVRVDMGCNTNWNNHNMVQLSMYHLVRNESDPALKAVYRAALRDQLWAPSDPFPMRDQKKTLYSFFYFVNRDPADAWPVQSARDSICTMKIFPEYKGHFAVDNFVNYTEHCKERGGDPMTDVVIPVNERGMDNFVWINNPYSMEKETENLLWVESPEDYLLAYWMGRFYGFITEDM